MSDGGKLSSRDERVLNLVFDAEAQIQTSTGTSAEASHEIAQTALVETVPEQIRLRIRGAINMAEQGQLKGAEAVLTDLIENAPAGRAAALNNRAQVRRLAGDVDGALRDLDRVIKNEIHSQLQILPSLFSRLLSDAYFHRATIYLLLAKGKITGRLGKQAPDTLEEWASADFAMAGRYGSGLARAMAVRTNPYAKLCGAIVQTALQREMRPEF